MACCQCCTKTGACCHPDNTCTEETCADCESLGGKWQGADTVCEAGSCPCSPPADRDACERCRDGSVETFCAAGQNCCAGVCQPSPCCCCFSITLNDLLYGSHGYSWPTIKPAGKRTPDHGTVGSPPSVSSSHCTDPKEANDAGTLAACCNETSPGVFAWTCKGRWAIRPACLRWLCRCVNGSGEVLCSQVYGGPTVNDANLTDLAMNVFGAESTAGCYVYTFEFFGWRRQSSKTVAADWIGRDDLYSIYKTEVTC